MKCSTPINSQDKDETKESSVSRSLKEDRGSAKFLQHHSQKVTTAESREQKVREAFSMGTDDLLTR